MDNENYNTEDCPINDLLTIVKQDNIEQLRDALLDVIDKTYPDGEIYLYEQGYSLYDTSKRSFSPSLLGCRSKHGDCMEKAQIIQSAEDSNSIRFDGFKYLPSDDYVQVFTVESERVSRGLLITINKNVINEDYIYTLLSAYNHQVQLLRNKDTDSLTGLLNRQSFDYKLPNIHSNLGGENRAEDESSKLCFALLDIDLFKKVNDEYGHLYGDEVLLLFTNVMRSTFRDADLLFRYGGDEFAVLLNNVSLKEAESVLNRFRSNVKKLNFPLKNNVTTSIGFCEFSDQIPLTMIIERADKALYYSKEHGRDKTSGFDTLLNNNEVQDIIISEGDVEFF